MQYRQYYVIIGLEETLYSLSQLILGFRFL